MRRLDSLNTSVIFDKIPNITLRSAVVSFVFNETDKKDQLCFEDQLHVCSEKYPWCSNLLPGDKIGWRNLQKILFQYAFLQRIRNKTVLNPFFRCKCTNAQESSFCQFCAGQERRYCGWFFCEYCPPSYTEILTLWFDR